MSKVTDNQLKGNFGEHFVAAKLSQHGCLVRAVASGTDVGVDLYCEMIQGKKPFLHFFVQVKSGDFATKGKDQASINLKKKHLTIWNKQPVPVFIFLVPILSASPPFSNPKSLYIIDISEQLLRFKLPPGQASKSYDSTMKIKIGAKNEERRWNIFLKQIPVTTSYLRLKEGVLAPVATPEPTDMITINLPDATLTHLYDIRKQIQHSAAGAIQILSVYERKATKKRELEIEKIATKDVDILQGILKFIINKKPYVPDVILFDAMIWWAGVFEKNPNLVKELYSDATSILKRASLSKIKKDRFQKKLNSSKREALKAAQDPNFIPRLYDPNSLQKKQSASNGRQD